MCSVLGRTLLWSCFDAEASAYVTKSIKDHVVNEYLNLPQQLPEGENPIKKVLLVINGAEDQVIITELGDMNEATGNGMGAGGQVSRNDYLALLHEVRHLRSENRQLHEMTTNRLSRLEKEVATNHGIMQGNIDRIARWPGQPRHQITANLHNGTAPALPTGAACIMKQLK